MGKCLPKVAAVSLCLLSLTGCVSRGEPGPAFPDSYGPEGQSAASQAPPAVASGTGFGHSPQPTSGWDGFVSAVTDNPVTRTFKSAGQKTVETLSPPQVETTYDPTSLSAGTPKADASMLVSMAQVQESSNNLEAAAQSYEKALQVDKKYVPAMLGLAQVRFRQQRHDEAYQLFSHARKIDPNNLTAMLGQAHYQDTRENMPEATRLYTEATQRHPESAPAWNDLGLCLARQRRLAESQQTLQRAVQLEPSNVLYRNNVATVLVELHRNDEALTHLQQAHGPAAGHYNLGFLLHRRGEDQAAAEQFSMALRVDPQMHAAQQWLDKINSGQENSQRAGRPPLGRSATMMLGPDGKSIALYTKNMSGSPERVAPPEVEHVAKNGPVDVVVEDAPAEVIEEPAKLVKTRAVKTASAARKAAPKSDVLPVSAVEISDDDASLENELPAEVKESAEVKQPAETSKRLRRVRVNWAHESDAENAAKSVEPAIIEAADEVAADAATAAASDEETAATDAPVPNDAHAGDANADAVITEAVSDEEIAPRRIELLQPKLVTGDTSDQSFAPAEDAYQQLTEVQTDLPITTLQPANEQELQLETPPTSDQEAAEQLEPEAGEYADEAGFELEQPEDEGSFIEPAHSDALQTAPQTSSPRVPAERAGWKAIK